MSWCDDRGKESNDKIQNTKSKNDGVDNNNNKNPHNTACL